MPPIRRGLNTLKEDGIRMFGQKFINYLTNTEPMYPIRKKLFYRKYHRPTNHLKTDFDNMIVLDACRFDILSNLHNLPGELEFRYSLGCWTQEWIENCISDSQFTDTVYVVGNPRISRYEEYFHETIPVWDFGWDDKLQVVPPDAVEEAALKAYRSFPNKRIIVHFMQPHVPFIGEFGRSEIGIHDGDIKGKKIGSGKSVFNDEFIDSMELVRRGKINPKDAFRAYKENLEMVLPHINTLLNKFEGLSIVTSDHGELFGEVDPASESRKYGHPENTLEPELFKIPWLTYQNGRRKTLTTEPSSSKASIRENKINERLSYLGYK